MTILDKIIANKKKELRAALQVTTIRDLEKRKMFSRATISLSGSIGDKAKTGIIAEFKRRSPSRGDINSRASVVEVTSGYLKEGASGVSILTDQLFFGGTSADLSNARQIGRFPILRKDFIIDEYQVVESKAIGADAILLIASSLRKSEIEKLAGLARSLELEVLLEIHEPEELDKITRFVSIIGVNNRNLKTFDVSTEVSELMAEKIPGEFLKISESGISSPQIIRDLRKAGYDGFLIGEKFMAAGDPVIAFAEFVKELQLNNEKS
jgi:indole-3-glycerol phosphate synthase